MFDSLRLKNFQSHKDTLLTFHPGINVICGESNVGKTSFFRALIKVWKNRPLGTRFMSNFANGSPTFISVSYDKNKFVSLEIGNETTYRVIETDSFDQITSKLEFKSMGSNVPDEVSVALNLQDLNIQDQLSKHFLITSTPGEVAKEFNKITNIDKVDIWVSSLTSKINGENRDVKLLEEQILETERELYKYVDVDKMEEDVAHGEYLQAQVISKQTRHVKLLNVLSEIKSIEGQLKTLKEISDPVSQWILELDVLSSQYNVKKQQLQNLQILCHSWKEEKKNRELVDFLDPLVTRLEKYLSDYTIVRQDEKDIKEYIFQLKHKEELLVDWRRNHNQQLNHLQSTLKLLGQCPLCFSPIDKDKIESILENL